MSDLANAKCTACNASSVALPDNEINQLIKSLPNWAITCEKIHDHNINDEHIITIRQKLTCTFHTKRYTNSLALTNAVANLAEKENHHPDILLTYSEVSVSWWTHVVNGLHKNDFIMAAKTTALFNAL